MGLDSYLYAKRYLSEYDKEEKIKREQIAKLFDGNEPIQITFQVMYWRKANAIHSWFVENCQDGNDDCRSYYVNREKLEELLEVINKILGVTNKEKVANTLTDGFDKEIAEELLPTTEGFFFGDTEYDEYYVNQLEETRKVLEKVLTNKKWEDYDFEYSSSW